MWLVIRLLVAIAAGIVKILANRWRGKPDGEVGGRATYQSVSKTKRGDITGFRLGICLDSGIVFDLHEETNADRFFKDLGLSQELRTGDDTFDHRIYVACDHLGFHDLLMQEPRVRAAIAVLFDAGFGAIRSDGKVISTKRSAIAAPTPEDFAPLVELADALACLEDKEGARTRMPRRFAIRFAIVEAVVWTLFGYAASSWIGLSLDLGWHYFEYGQLVLLGAMASAVVIAVLFGLIVLFLRGSSRGHRILVECAILLVLAVPVTGVAIISDVNSHSKGAPPIMVECGIVSKDKVVRRRRKGGTTTSYYLNLAPPTHQPVGFEAPRRVQVGSGDFQDAEPNGVLVLEIEPGALGIPWIAERTVRPPAAGD
jgi:hypothetical protein